MNKKIVLSVIRLMVCGWLFLLSSLTAFASTFKPVVSNYDVWKYGLDAGVQNWACAQGDNGEIYIGNNKGLLIFNGYQWNRVEVPGGSVVRSILIDNGRIYVGSYEEFGYFIRTPLGKLEYHSLSASLPDATLANQDIWNILSFRGKICFQSFDRCFLYDGTSVSDYYDPLLKPLYFHPISASMLVQIIGKGLYSFDGKRYQPAYDRSLFGNDNVVAILPLDSAGHDALFFTERHGIFRKQGTRFAKFHTADDAALTRYQVNRAVLTRDSVVVVGTLMNGIYAFNLKGNRKWHFDINDGLNSNSVLRLFCDKDNNVWAALDNGVALVHSGLPFYVMKPERDETQIGMVYGLDIQGKDLLLATNQGLYRCDMESGELNVLPGTSGQNWHISTFGNTTFVGNNGSTLLLRHRTSVEPVPGTESSSTLMKRCRINGKDVILESTYSDLRIYRQEGSRWRHHTVKGFMAPLRQIEVDQSGTIWAANMNVGIYRIELTSDLDSVSSSHYFKCLGDTVPSVNYVMKIRGRVVFSDCKRLYTYDDISGRIIPYDVLNSQLLSVRNLHSCTAVDDRNFWISGQDSYYWVRYDRGRFVTRQSIPVSFFGLQYNEFGDRVFLYRHYAFFNMNNGVGCYDMNPHRRMTRVYPRLLADSISYAASSGQSLSIDPSQLSDYSNTERNISFYFSFPNFNKEKLTFVYTLNGPSSQQNTSDKPRVRFNNLRYGNYHLGVEVYTESHRLVGSARYSFIMTRPLLLSAPMVSVYVLFGLLIIFLLFRWRVSTLLEKKRKEYQAERNRQSIRILEQEKLIALQQQQLLQSELSVKSRELASLALNACAKEKEFENLRESVALQGRKGGIASKDLRELLSKFDQDSNDNEFWTIYQKNFDLINERFFQNLRERYPSLTAGDLRFCALLKLNLSTKDIAKFTNLTIRGVETARYRIRKKLNIPDKTSLTEFLIDFK